MFVFNAENQYTDKHIALPPHAPYKGIEFYIPNGAGSRKSTSNLLFQFIAQVLCMRRGQYAAGGQLNCVLFVGFFSIENQCPLHINLFAIFYLFIFFIIVVILIIIIIVIAIAIQ